MTPGKRNLSWSSQQSLPGDFQLAINNKKTGKLVLGVIPMSWSTTEWNPLRKGFSRQNAMQLLMLLLFFYFSVSGASELGIMNGVGRKFEGHPWFGRTMGFTELFGGLALLRQEGILGGACFLMVAMACGIGFALANHKTYAAAECLLMLNICLGIYWQRRKALAG